MPAVHDVRLPEIIEQGAKGGPAFSTLVAETTGGNEKRVAQGLKARMRWNVATGARDAAALSALLAFWYARQGRLYRFRFKDWSDYQAPAGSPVMLVPGSVSTYRLAKAYTSGGVTYLRPISRPVAGTTILSSGSVDHTSGFVSGGPATTWTGEFDVAVRFEKDEFDITLDQVDIGVADFGVVELREA